MLKAWIKRDDEALLIVGLTFRNLAGDGRNYIPLWSETFDIPMNVVLVTAPSRQEIAGAIANAKQVIATSSDDPVWHCVTRRHHTKTLHVCLSQIELLSLRRHPLVSYYRIKATINTSFDTLLIGTTNEDELVKFLTRVRLIDETARVELDHVQMRC